MVKVEAVTERGQLGEGPHWDEEQQVLYFVIPLKSSVIKYDPATKTQTSVRVGTETRYPSLVIPVEGRRDQFLITLGRSIAVMTWDGVSSEPAKVETLCSVHERSDEQENKFNDGKVDPTGRFWAGTLGEVTMSLEAKTKGCLFSFSKNWVPSVHLTDVSISNGMAWSADQKTMYYIDSLLHRVDALDFNSETGELSNRRVVFDFKKSNLPDDCFPDGMTIDTEGKLWVACFRGGQVIRVDPTSGKLVGSVSLPVPQVTSVAFGGPNLDELYVTSGNVKLSDKDDCDLKYAGCTFRVTGVGAKGFPAKKAQLA